MEASVERNPLILLYRSLDRSAIRRLGKWLDSPAHNQRADVRQLHAYLTGGNDRLFTTSALAKARVWRKLFPGHDFDDARLRQTFHWALKATQAFLAYETWTSDPVNEHLALVRGLRRRGLSSATHRGLKKTGQLLQRSPIRNETYYRKQYTLALEHDEHRVYHRLLEKPNFQEIADALDAAYLIEKLKVSCNMLFHARLNRTEFDLRFLDDVISMVKTYDLQKHPVLAVYFYVYRGFTENDDSGANIGLLREAINRHSELLTPTDVRYVILMAINLCISNMNKGLEPFFRESFEWYKLGFSRNVIAENNLLTRNTYLNVIAIAMRLREFAWIETFIAEQTHLLEEDIRENTERFARARLSYEQKDYATSMPLLVQVDFKQPVYNLLARTLLAKIYYELGEFDALDSHLDSMTTYLRRKELADLHQQNFGNFLRHLRQLTRLAPRDRNGREAFTQKVKASFPLSEKKWLLEQVD